ncbi:MAG: hypothetical protein H6811_04030 [Phycisphaeraceae bacterium]|nr:hypothetical protein [Phycisphaeraceae bacterium]
MKTPRTQIRHAGLAASLAALACAPPCLAQIDDPVEPRLDLPVESEPVIRPSPTQWITPVRVGAPSPLQSLASLQGEDVSLPAARQIREGAFIIRREGVVVRAPTGEAIFVFRKDEDGNAEPPMVLLPCRSLATLEGEIERVGGDAAITLSGQVLLYQSRNYLLPTFFRVRQLAPPARPQPNQPASGAGARGEAEDPRVAELIRQLESAAPIAPPPDQPATQARPAGEPPEPGDAAPGGLEGEFLVRVRTRLVRTTSGRWAASIDQGPRAPAAEPLVLLPSRTLESMERLVATRGESLTILVSGRVYAYRGQRYLLATGMLVEPPNDLRPR